MLILRKELKVGLGIGAAMLGVAAVYGAMSLLTGGGQSTTVMNSGDGGTTETLQLDGAGGKPADAPVFGLPPRETPVVEKPTTVAGDTVATTPDPLTESARRDGVNTNADMWSIAFKTGQVVTDVQPAIGAPTGNNGPIRTQNPTGGDVRNPLESAGTSDAGNATEPRQPTERRQASPAAGAGKYVIQPGDSFSSIAGKVYGNRNLYHHITRANPNVDPARLKPGMEIVVPAADAVKNDRGSITMNREPAITGAIDANREYRVQAGDTLHKISQRLYGKTNQWMAIYDMNKSVIGPDAGRLKVGTVLVLPQVPTQR